jgi:hypothetical protein
LAFDTKIFIVTLHIGGLNKSLTYNEKEHGFNVKIKYGKAEEIIDEIEEDL